MTKPHLQGAPAAWTLICLLLAGCPSGTTPQQTSDPDLGRPAADLGCYAKPQTHIELLNACTTAQSVDKMPGLPLLGKDGKLPPLP